MQHINYGIDLGTTNSCIARFEGGEVRVIQNADQMNVTPSVVRVLRSGGVMTGRRAYNAVVEDPDNVAAEFKRLMGQKFQKTFPASGRAMSPEELSAEVLKSLLADARRQTGDAAGAAVVTVPAAFTALQCEATARAARLAGLEEFPLLQEPIAAAVAYGARPGSRDQRWLVFDLGGGTFDTAVVSTRDNRLSVLEHRGDNHLGGKDLDRAVVRNVFLPFLSERFALPTPDAHAAALNRLERKLTFVAEYAKIELTDAEKTVVSFIDLGEDLEGRFIEAELTLTRAELERELEPLLARCLRLAQDALEGARLSGADLDRILLVGGPTQMPAVRARVGAALGARVDFSLDPMTVVARGACIYASSVERQPAASPDTTRLTKIVDTETGASADEAGDASGQRADVRLAFDAVSASVETIVAGRVTDARVREVSIAAVGGFWESGWHPVREELFEIAVRLQEGKLCAFRLAARDARGLEVAIAPETFRIRHGLEVGAPPLPHTISVEVALADAAPRLDPVFPRRTLLPAEKTVHYRAARTLRPSEPETSLAIKLWEGEALDEPQANHWVGNMHVRAEQLRRPIPEGAEIQLHLRVDASRLITVDVFVPHLNEHFTERVYIPQDEEPDYAELLAGVPSDLGIYLMRLARVESRLLLREAEAPAEETREIEDEFPEFVLDEEEAASQQSPRRRTRAERPALVEVERLRREAEDLDIEITLRRASGTEADHDEAKGFVERAREIRARLVSLERRAGLDPNSARLEDAERLAAEIGDDIKLHGTEREREQYEALRRELQGAVALGDARGAQKCLNSLKLLRRQVLYAQDWFWQDWFDHLLRPGREFVNTEEARKWLARGEEARASADRAKLEEAVRWLWSLQPVEDQAAARERAARPGLKL
ncbi:MAG TPA: Hsp70 family protein [Pyrinomonadaceae bacterium]|nr:Hsp70 family protein [Pyrinomonadaceae bacterium]